MDKDTCRVCGRKIEIAIFRGTGYCCDDHRKVLTGEKPWPDGSIVCNPRELG